MNETQGVFTMTDTARVLQIGRQAVYAAVKAKKLKGEKDSRNRWWFHQEEIDRYKKEKYSRNLSMVNGKRIFDEKVGTYSVKHSAKILGIKFARLYYLIRLGRVKTKRVGAAYVLTREQLNEMMAQKIGSQKKENAI